MILLLALCYFKFKHGGTNKWRKAQGAGRKEKLCLVFYLEPCALRPEPFTL